MSMKRLIKLGTAMAVCMGMILCTGRYIRAMRKRLVAKPMMMRRFLSAKSF